MIKPGSNLSIGCEAEFVCTAASGGILRLSPHILEQADLVGADGHEDTTEIRTSPTADAPSQFRKLCSATAKYAAVLAAASNVWEKAPLPIKSAMRGGAWFGTPLSVHIHFAGFDGDEQMGKVSPMLDLLHSVLVCQFLDVVGSAKEQVQRKHSGRYGHQGLPSFRHKGPGWWEWREPFSCMTPPHMAILLGGSEVIARAVLSLEAEAVRSLTAKLETYDLPSCLMHISLATPGGARVTWDLDALCALTTPVLKIGVIDWSRDLLPLWIGG